MSRDSGRKKNQSVILIVIILVVIGLFLLSRTRQATRVDQRHVLTRP
ncbi:MAG: hypothetical protein WAN10_05400 [Candidatus Acidiferrales bacterium]